MHEIQGPAARTESLDLDRLAPLKPDPGRPQPLRQIERSKMQGAESTGRSFEIPRPAVPALNYPSHIPHCDLLLPTPHSSFDLLGLLGQLSCLDSHFKWAPSVSTTITMAIAILGRAILRPKLSAVEIVSQREARDSTGEGGGADGADTSLRYLFIDLLRFKDHLRHRKLARMA